MRRKFIILTFILLIGILAAGCTVGKLPSSSNNEEILNGNGQLKIETKTISDDSQELESNIILPIFTSENNQEPLNKINNIIKESALSAKEELAKMSKSDFENTQKQNIDFRKYELLVDYEVHTASSELISVTTLNYYYTGGAHGLSVKIPYNFNLTTGKEITLGVLFKEGSAYKKLINEEIQKQIKEDPDKFFPDEVELFSGISENQAFYIEDEKLVIYFGQYEISPYSSGIIEFEIPSSILKDVVSSSFIK